MWRRSLLAIVAGCLSLHAQEPTLPLRLISQPERGELEVRWRGQRLFLYAFASNQFKPYVRELYGLNRVNVLRDAPADHLHHHGLMYAIRVNGVNFWEEQNQPGHQRHLAWLAQRTGRTSEGRPLATFTELIHWVPNKDKDLAETQAAALLVERRTLTLIIDEPNEEVALEWQAEFEVGSAAVNAKLHGSAYNGLGLRLPQEFDQVARHSNSENLPYSAEAKGDVTAAKWSAVSHRVGGRDVTVALFGHPTNPGEVRFFTMLNPFAYLSVTQNLEKSPLAYAAGDRFRLRYLVVLCSGIRKAEQLQPRFLAWEKKDEAQ